MSKFNSKTLNWCTKEADVLSCRINQLLSFHNQGYNRLRPIRISKASQHLNDSYKEKKLLTADSSFDEDAINTDLCYVTPVDTTLKQSVDDTKLFENKQQRQSRGKRRFLSLRKQRNESKSREPIHPTVLQSFDLRNYRN